MIVKAIPLDSYNNIPSGPNGYHFLYHYAFEELVSEILSK